MNVLFCFRVLDMDLVADVDVKITHRGTSPITWGPPERCDPGSAPEWELECVTLYEDTGKQYAEGPKLECPDWLEAAIVDSEKFSEAVVATLADEEDDGPDPDAEHDKAYD